MSTIRQLSSKELREFAQIGVNAYPGFEINTKEKIEKFQKSLIETQQQDPNTSFFGLFRDEVLLGGMRIHDFTMNYKSNEMNIGGIGLVAVDLVHKKEKVCKEMLEYFIHTYFDKSVPIVALYPFRPDFYKKMGFGYGTKMDSYTISPSSFPRGSSKENITLLDLNDIDLIHDCYHRFYEKRFGMIKRDKSYFKKKLINPKIKYIGCKKDGRLLGYVSFKFKPLEKDNFLLNDMEIQELIYENEFALSQISTFLNTQADQIKYIHFHTQDECFHHFLTDPRNDTEHLIPPVYHESHTSGVGIMYRVINPKLFINEYFTSMFFRDKCNVRVKLTDTFFPQNEKSIILEATENHTFVSEDSTFDVEIKLDVSDFSSLVMGVIRFKTLHEYGKLEISDKTYIDKLDNLFLVEEKPICMTVF